MVKSSKTIFTGFLPHATRKDATEAFFMLCRPWSLGQKNFVTQMASIKQWFRHYFSVPHVFLCDSGRTGLFLALQVLGVQRGSDVAVQAYTCLVVVNAIRFLGARPIFIDIDANYCMSPTDLQKKITEKTKAIFIQHTFGYPAAVDSILSIAKERGIATIEDCAHSLGARHGGRLTGTFGDMAIFSFGSDKVVSSVRGGAILTREPRLAEILEERLKRLPSPPWIESYRVLLTTVLFVLCKPLYHCAIGKWVLGTTKKLGVTHEIISEEEKRGERDLRYPTQFLGVGASMLLRQLYQLDDLNTRRREIVRQYRERITNIEISHPPYSSESIFLRYPLSTKDPAALHEYAKKRGILLGNWYTTVVAPTGTYTQNNEEASKECGEAVCRASSSINLPTDPLLTNEAVERVIETVRTYRKEYV